jgi:hypothetical protein
VKSCIACAEDIKSDAKLCKHCGVRQDDIEFISAGTSSLPPNPDPQLGGGVSKTQKSKTVAWVLTISFVSIAALIWVVSLAATGSGNSPSVSLDESSDATPTPSSEEISFCRWWIDWYSWPDEDAFYLPDAVLSDRAFDRALEIVRRQPLSSGLGTDWYALTDRYGEAMLAMSERAYLRNSSGWGTVLDQVRTGYNDINGACAEVNVANRLSSE